MIIFWKVRSRWNTRIGFVSNRTRIVRRRSCGGTTSWCGSRAGASSGGNLLGMSISPIQN
uniref:Uncharacterized protein n=1 Tax=Octopus bimaculoides TaxID=37653 RepID=A0A0L8FVH3_OCTBM